MKIKKILHSLLSMRVPKNPSGIFAIIEMPCKCVTNSQIKPAYTTMLSHGAVLHSTLRIVQMRSGLQRHKCTAESLRLGTTLIKEPVRACTLPELPEVGAGEG